MLSGKERDPNALERALCWQKEGSKMNKGGLISMNVKDFNALAWPEPARYRPFAPQYNTSPTGHHPPPAARCRADSADSPG